MLARWSGGTLFGLHGFTYSPSRLAPFSVVQPATASKVSKIAVFRMVVSIQPLT
jgi:hypothetical protein